MHSCSNQLFWYINKFLAEYTSNIQKTNKIIEPLTHDILLDYFKNTSFTLSIFIKNHKKSGLDTFIQTA
tara:strand:- start:2694 stop:2900 length:207 start_codon:yes stop_codon:yes gene_type:complete